MYLEHFRLSAEPFGLTPDPAFLYLSPGHREALAAIQYGLLDRRGFITLVGEVGTGKTTLLYAMLSRLDRAVEAAYIAYGTQDFEDVLAAVLADLGVETPRRSKHALLTAFSAHLLRRADEGRTVALVIDEAQNLSDRTFEELRLISNFETYTQKLLQIVLVGEPELQRRLRQPQLRQLRERVSVRAFVNPLSTAEMYRYIEHRLHLVGGSSEKLFAPRALRLIVQLSAGNPRRANILCHNALLFAYGRTLPRATATIARTVVAEMDGRLPGLLPRRLGTLGRGSAWLRWAAGAVGSVPAERGALIEPYPEGDPPAPASAAPAVEAPVAPAPAASDAPPVPAESAPLAGTRGEDTPAPAVDSGPPRGNHPPPGARPRPRRAYRIPPRSRASCAKLRGADAGCPSPDRVASRNAPGRTP